MATERDFLVFYEEPDPDGLPNDDSLLLDIDAGQAVSLGELDVEQKLDLELANNTNRLGTVGFVLACVGTAVAFGVSIYFGLTYPDKWYDDEGNVYSNNVIPGTALVGVIAFLLMLLGVILTHYGRRIQARGNLSRIRIVEKAFQPRVTVEDQ